MARLPRSTPLSSALLFLLFLGGALPLVSTDGSRPALPGIPNFDTVTEQILRGGQPRELGYQALKDLGVAIVVSFRGESGVVARERAELASRGIQFVNIPWSGLGYPRPEQVKEFFDLVDSHPAQKIFLHCQRGSERTGVMVALYRIARQGWSGEQAYREMKAHGFRSFWFRHLREYVFDFARQVGRPSPAGMTPRTQAQHP